jgi:hypothetical protein
MFGLRFRSIHIQRIWKAISRRCYAYMDILCLTHIDMHSGREVKEIEFTPGGLTIGGLPAYDYFGDGSLYLLNTPGVSVTTCYLTLLLGFTSLAPSTASDTSRRLQE